VPEEDETVVDDACKLDELDEELPVDAAVVEEPVEVDDEAFVELVLGAVVAVVAVLPVAPLVAALDPPALVEAEAAVDECPEYEVAARKENKPVSPAPPARAHRVIRETLATPSSLDLTEFGDM
jgi:hypothetical protein